MSAPIRYLDVCSGYSAFTVAAAGLGFQCAGYSEIDAFPRAMLEQRHGAVAVDWDHRHAPGSNITPLFGDFTQIEAHHVGPVDLLIGGTPCQAFSVAGKRLGLDDPRGNLTLEFLALARRLRVPWLAWENVHGFLSHDEGRTMGTFLGLLGELGYGWVYRVLDVQYIRVGGFPWAIPQRRRRVFVVAHLGDQAGPAAVLFDRESLRGDPAPRRETGEGVAGTLGASAARSRGAGIDPGPLTAAAFGGGNTAGPVDVGACLTAKGQRIDFEVETFVAHSLRADGFDASEDGTGRGTPLVPVAYRVTPNDGAYETGDHCASLTTGTDQTANVVAYSIMPQNSSRDYKAREVDVAQPLMAGGPVAGNQGGDYIAFSVRGRDGEAQAEPAPEGLSPSLRTGGGGSSHAFVADQWAVRRLTPTECERLMGVPDHFTAITYRGKPAADGPRYKCLGNSQGVNVMRWIAHGLRDVIDAQASRIAA